MEVETKGFRVDLSRAQWQKSTRSGPNCDNCVEVAFVDEAIAVRDSKNPTGPVLIFTPTSGTPSSAAPRTASSTWTSRPPTAGWTAV